MSLERWAGKGNLIERISSSIIGNKVTHAYIIQGDTTVDKQGFATDFLKAVNCQEKPGIGCDECLNCRKIDHGNCEDLHLIQSDGKSVKDQSIFHLQELLSRKPLGERNMVIISDGDTMTTRAQNRLLKTLEEPKGNAIILILVNNEENLLQTIRSRCISYSVPRIDNNVDNRKIFELADELLDLILEGAKFLAVRKLLLKSIKSKNDALELVDAMEIALRNILLGTDERNRFFDSDKTISAIHFIEECRKDIIYNVSYNSALKNLMIKIGG